jgi:hypothetical protein
MSIVKHPIAYIMHRLAHFNSVLYFIVPSHHADIPVVLAIMHGRAVNVPPRSTTKIILDNIRSNPFTTPAFWLVVGVWSFVILSTAKSPRYAWQHEAALALTASALLYTIAYLIISVATDSRYVFWSLMASFTAVVISLPELTERFKSPGRLEWTCAVTLGLTIVLIVIARVVGGDSLSEGMHCLRTCAL